jgi:hypothetical protein
MFTFDDLKFVARISKIQAIHTFPNGRGISVIQRPWDRPNYEMAVLDKNGNLDFSTDVTDDVLADRDKKEIAFYGRQVEALP